MDEMLTVYALIFGMEEDVPGLYTTDKVVAEHLKYLMGGSDFLEIEMAVEEWEKIFQDGLKKKGDALRIRQEGEKDG